MSVPTKNLQKSHTGFSIRMNEFLNFHPEIPKERGRISRVSKILIEARTPLVTNNSPATVRNWITNNIRPYNLPEIIEILLDGTKLSVNCKEVVSWLDRGNEVKNPFAKITSKSTDHLTRSQVYIAVNDHAKNLKIDLESLSDDVRTLIYDSIFLFWNKDEEDNCSMLINNLLKISKNTI